jgi:hypothetical protein
MREARMRQLGLSEQRVEHAGKLLPASRSFEVIGSRMEPVRLVRVPGKVMWVDFDLARELGFSVPPDNRMTEELEQELLEALSYRVLGEGEDPAGREIIEGGADRYGGTGIMMNLGAGRAAFLPWLNVNIKGVGITPLSVPEPDDFTHSHGGAPAREGLLEAIWGLQADNLLTHKGTRILAVIDTGDGTEWADQDVEPRALIARVGNQLRPGHVLDPTVDRLSYRAADFSPGLFVAQARESGILAERNGAPDFRATMLNALDRQCLLSAELFRHRIFHGAVSTSNIEWDGGLLDNGTTVSLTRTEPARVLDFGRAFGNEHRERADELELVYRALAKQLKTSTVPGHTTARHIDFFGETRKRYTAHMALQMFDATGFKPELAKAVAIRSPDLAYDYADCLIQLASLARKRAVNIDQGPAPDVATVDIFNLLRTLPQRYFFEPTLDLRAAVREGLGVEGNESRKLSALINRFTRLFPQVIGLALDLGGQFYDDIHAMKRSIINRVNFENRPIDGLERAALRHKLNLAIDDFRRDAAWAPVGSPARIDPIREAVDKTVAASVRSVEGLLRQGRRRALADGGFEVEARTIDGIDHSVRCWPTGKRRLHLSIPLRSEGQDGYALPSLRVEGEDRGPHLHTDQLDALSFRFSTDGWNNVQEVKATLGSDDAGAPRLEFDIPVLSSDVGTLEGLFHCTGRGDFWWHDGTSNFRGYTYAVPDRQELAELAKALTPLGPIIDWQ